MDNKADNSYVNILRDLGITPTKEELKELMSFKTKREAEPTFLRIRNKYWAEEGFKL